MVVKHFAGKEKKKMEFQFTKEELKGKDSDKMVKSDVDKSITDVQHEDIMDDTDSSFNSKNSESTNLVDKDQKDEK